MDSAPRPGVEEVSAFASPWRRASSRRYRSWASRAPSRPPPGHRSPSHRRERRHRSFSPTHSRASASNRRRGRRMIDAMVFDQIRRSIRSAPVASPRVLLSRVRRERRARSSRSATRARERRRDANASRCPETSSRPIRSSPHGGLRIPRARPVRLRDARKTRTNVSRDA